MEREQTMILRYQNINRRQFYKHELHKPLRYKYMLVRGKDCASVVEHAVGQHQQRPQWDTYARRLRGFDKLFIIPMIVLSAA